MTYISTRSKSTPFPRARRASSNVFADWLKFRICGGRYQGIIVGGTDGHDTDPTDTDYPSFPDDDVFLEESDVADITLAANIAQTYFWVDCSNSVAPVIAYSADPANNGWGNFPNTDSGHIPIGWIDTQFDQANCRPVIRQLVRTDLTPAGVGGNAAPASLLTVYWVKSYANYWLCAASSDGSGTHYRVAKCPQLRQGTASNSANSTSANIYGQVVNFTYDHNIPNDPLYGIYRTSIRVSDGYTEDEAVNPEPVQYFAVKCMPDANTGVMVEDLDVSQNPGDHPYGTSGGNISNTTAVALYDLTGHGMAWMQLNGGAL